MCVPDGWQGNLSQIHVKPSDVDTVDSNLQKMAAMGLSVMISSGDSGSGYTPAPSSSCTSVFDVSKVRTQEICQSLACIYS